MNHDLNTALQQIVEHYAACQQEDSTGPKNPIPRVPYPVAYGFIRFEGPIIVAGDYYTGNRKFAAGIKVGGTVSREVHKQIREEVRTAVEQTGGRFEATGGTAWSFYGMRS